MSPSTLTSPRELDGAAVGLRAPASERRSAAAMRAAWPGPGDLPPHRLIAAPVASPMHRATTSDCWLLESERGDAAVFVKHLQPEMADWVDPTVAAAAQARAAELGVAPGMLCVDALHGCIAQQWLAPPWRTAMLSDLSRPDRLHQVLLAKTALHRGGPLAAADAGHGPNVFERIEHLIARSRATAEPLPGDLPWLIHQAAAAQSAIQASGTDRTLCHGDGSASNVMLGPDGALLMVDFDLASNQDPWYDLASTLVEACEFAEDWAPALERLTGRAEQSLLSRLHLYGLLDDLMWGLWGCLMATASPRKGIEFFKYGHWRLLRCRQTAKAWAFEQWLRTV